MNKTNDAVGTGPDPGAKAKRHAPTIITIVALGAIALIAGLLIAIGRF
jgi:hypothetical protein